MLTSDTALVALDLRMSVTLFGLGGLATYLLVYQFVTPCQLRFQTTARTSFEDRGVSGRN